MPSTLKLSDCRMKWYENLVLAVFETAYVGYFKRVIALSSVRGHLVHFAKFPMLKFSKGYSYHSFLPISTELFMERMVRSRENTGYYVLP